MRMDVLTGMRVFSAVVNAGSFVSAAEKLGLSNGMATRYVAQLEAHLGLRLLNRTTRKLSLTEAGADYLEQSSQILAMIEEAESSAAQRASVPRGTLRVTTSVGLGVLDMGQLITEFLGKHPGLKVDLVLNDRVVDLVEEGFDIAIRMGPRVDLGLVARKIADVRIVVCASKSYLKKQGVPQIPQDLASHNCLTYSYSSQEADWPFMRDGTEEKVRVSGTFRANNGTVLANAAIAGLGIIRQPDYLVSDAIDRKLLVPVLPAWDAGAHAIYAVYSSRRFLPTKVRALIDFLVERFE
ncbi:putative transcriptional regulator [Collimonas fungivorans Ter331]|uniref:Putative transcriptional regulator n=2 Tax=Collimonas fungivorans TaxID=158899 RepID=G0AER6_COLFT|nr:putative transcriptional regulator [Collimonas fungivorans Ter331]